MDNIRIVNNDNWRDFFHNELLIDYEPTKNYYQLFPTSNIVYDQKLQYFCGLNAIYDETKWFFFYEIDGLIVGQVSLQLSPKENDLLWLNSISIDPDFKNKGISKILIEYVFKWVKENEFRLLSSYYETEGEIYSKHVLRRFAKEIQIVFYDKDSICEPYHEWGVNERSNLYF